MINNNWIFGFNSGLDFSTNPPTPTSNNLMKTYEGCATVSDKNGILLFYTDGRTIWDHTHSAKVTGLLGDPSSTQSAIIVPDPSDSEQYYVLTIDGSSNSVPPFNHFNGGLLNIHTWNFQPMSSLMTLPSTAKLSPAEKITAVQHKNCRDYWVITAIQKGKDGSTTNSGISKGPGLFRIYEINANGIRHHIDIDMKLNISDIGYLKSNNKRSHLAIANTAYKQVLVYPFNNSTGLIDLSGLQTIDAKYGVYGVAFSPNSSILYYGTLHSGNTNGYVYQVDYLNNLNSTKVGTFKNKNGRYAIGALQLGIDNRIYIAKDAENSLGAIENPDILGVGCNLKNNFITLPKGSKCMLGLPNLLPNACEDHDDCSCGCNGCNEDAKKQNEELIERAKTKFNTIKSDKNCPEPFAKKCELSVIDKKKNLNPCFSFHWGDGAHDQIEEHDTEVFYITVCNNYNDITYNGLRITKVTLSPDIHPLDKIHIVPDRFINFDCLEPCTCQTRAFAMINRANDTAGNYTLEVTYCYEEILLAKSGNSGVAKFPVVLTED